MIEGVDNFAHAVYRVEGDLVGLVARRVLEDDQNTLALIQDAQQLFVEYHLREFLLYLSDRQRYARRYVTNLKKNTESVTIKIILIKKFGLSTVRELTQIRQSDF